MSTKNLRELVEMAEEAWPGRPINAVAKKELEAIERTAKDLLTFALNPGAPGALDKWNAATDTLTSIAEDAP